MAVLDGDDGFPVPGIFALQAFQPPGGKIPARFRIGPGVRPQGFLAALKIAQHGVDEVAGPGMPARGEIDGFMNHGVGGRVAGIQLVKPHQQGAEPVAGFQWPAHQAGQVIAQGAGLAQGAIGQTLGGGARVRGPRLGAGAIFGQGLGQTALVQQDTIDQAGRDRARVGHGADCPPAGGVKAVRRRS